MSPLNLAMEPQVLDLDQWLEDSWSTDLCQPQIVHTFPDMSPNYPVAPDNITFDTKDFQGLENSVPAYNLMPSSSPTDLQLSPSISNLSSPDAGDLFNLNQAISSWESMSLNNEAISPTNIWNTASLGGSPKSPELSSPSSSSASNSPPAVRQKKSKTSTKRNSKQTKSSLSNPRNSHNLIEKKYRTNLNNKIMCLKDRIPSLTGSSENENDDDEDDRPMKVNKGIILEKAIDYIAELEREKDAQASEIVKLRSMINSTLNNYLYANSLQNQQMTTGY